MTDSQLHDLLESLAGMPALVASAVERVGPRFRDRPAAGGFSLLEHVWHLGDLEREGFGERIARLRRGDRPRLRDFAGDRVARERDYQSLNLGERLTAVRSRPCSASSACKGRSRAARSRHGGFSLRCPRILECVAPLHSLRPRCQFASGVKSARRRRAGAPSAAGSGQARSLPLGFKAAATASPSRARVTLEAGAGREGRGRQPALATDGARPSGLPVSS
jgi:hypothetical protein